MDDETIGQLRAIVARFRHALETHGPRSGSPALRHFPRDSCADAVLLLGAYLADRGLGPFDAVGGDFEDPSTGVRYSHAWLERDDVIVDITADQFPGISEAVIVTRDRVWHSRFHTTNRGVADFRGYGSQTRAELGQVYERIRETIDGQ
jgi:hypothetical protein